LEREVGASNPRALAAIRKLQRYVLQIERERQEMSIRETELQTQLENYQRKGAEDAARLVGLMRDADARAR